MSNVIGIDATIIWLGEEDEPANRYISFGEWDEKDDDDTYGVPDSAIFFYSIPDELFSLYEQDEQRGWYIKSHNERIING